LKGIPSVVISDDFATQAIFSGNLDGWIVQLLFLYRDEKKKQVKKNKLP